MRTLYSCPFCSWSGEFAVEIVESDYLDDMYDRPATYETWTECYCPDCGGYVETEPACAQCGERPATDDDYCSLCAPLPDAVPGPPIAEFASGSDALAFKRLKGATYTVTAGINYVFAVREMTP